MTRTEANRRERDRTGQVNYVPFSVLSYWCTNRYYNLVYNHTYTVSDQNPCTHCGRLLAEEHSLVFEEQWESKVVALFLCPRCLGLLLDEPDIRKQHSYC